jgi:hypothetical protein
VQGLTEADERAREVETLEAAALRSLGRAFARVKKRAARLYEATGGSVAVTRGGTRWGSRHESDVTALIAACDEAEGVCAD